MIRRVEIHRRAREDIRAAAKWYRGQRAGLDRDFLDCIEQALIQLEGKGDLLSPVYRDCRRIWVKRFPYGIFYRLADDRITVVAVLHNRQSLSRLDPR